MYTMTIRKLLDELDKHELDSGLKIEYKNKLYSYNSISSWKGDFSELAIEYCEYEDEEYPIIVEDLILDLEDALNGRMFDGPRGGTFFMDEYTPVWVDKYNQCSCQGVVSVYAKNGIVVVKSDSVNPKVFWPIVKPLNYKVAYTDLKKNVKDAAKLLREGGDGPTIAALLEGMVR